MKKTFFSKAVSVLLSAAVLTCSAFSGLLGVGAAAAAAPTAAKQVSDMTSGWNLGNTLDSCGDWIGKYTKGRPSDYETAWGNPVTTKAMITAVKKAGFNSVRVPVTWAEHIDDKGNIDEDWLARVHEVVDYVLSQDLYCILNVHHDGGTDGWLEASPESYKKNAKKYEALWKNIANSFKSCGNKLLFESFNEMLDKNNSWTESKNADAYEAINDYNQLFVDSVRSTGGNNKTRNLVVQTYSAACTDKTLKNFVLPEDTVKDHLIVQVHNYDPQGFTTKGVTWTKDVSEWGSDKDKQDMDKLFARLGKYSDQWGAPVIVGEFAADYKNNDAARGEYAYYFTSKAAEYGIKCFWWDTGDMAILDRNAAKMIHPEVVKGLIDGPKNAKPAASGQGTSQKTETEKSDTSEAKEASISVKAKLSGTSVKLTWNEVEGADAYRVYRYDEETGKYVRVVTVKGKSYTIKGLSSGTCKFKVAAVEKVGNKYKAIATSKAVKVTVK
ncbi:MAG: cellulase family glycosylhydrolase [Huintestinicola sp.]